jgi:hypothetical protein
VIPRTTLASRIGQEPPFRVAAEIAAEQPFAPRRIRRRSES